MLNELNVGISKSGLQQHWIPLAIGKIQYGYLNSVYEGINALTIDQ